MTVVTKLEQRVFFFSQMGRTRFEHCYADEDLMGHLRKLASATHVRTMGAVTLGRYRALILLTDVI